MFIPMQNMFNIIKMYHLHRRHLLPCKLVFVFIELSHIDILQPYQFHMPKLPISMFIM